jgi:phage tail P2-like protein
VSEVPVPIASLWRPQDCPPEHLPWLAWAFSVDVWSPAWTDQQKRDAIGASYAVHRHKGTVGAMRTALAAIGYAIEMREWFQESPPGLPYTFGVIVDVGDDGTDGQLFGDVEAVALAAKNARSHLQYTRIRTGSAGQIHVGGSTATLDTITILPLGG